MIVNRYWNQLDEDIRVLLQRFDAETAIAREGTVLFYLTSYHRPLVQICNLFQLNLVCIDFIE